MTKNQNNTIKKNIDFEKHTRFLVTGGAGFIGSNLTEFLLNQGYHVRVLDNFMTGKRENIQSFRDHPHFEMIEGDIRNIDICQKSCENIDYVLHQAALGSVPRSVEDPITSNDVNVNGTLNMLVAAKDHHVKKFVYASSSSVYGDEETLPKKEGKEGNLLSPYAITKATNELYAQNFATLYRLPTIGLRYFNVFGKRQDPHSVYAAVIPIFVKHLIHNHAPTINGDGEQSRDFTYIDNVIEANLLACLADEKSDGQAFNIAYSDRATLKELYTILCQLLGKDIQPLHGPDRPGDIKHSFADITKARNMIGYAPDIDLQKGLEQTIEWYKNNL
jgi:UDP-N-acetylglucosamine 4-epimerase